MDAGSFKYLTTTPAISKTLEKDNGYNFNNVRATLKIPRGRKYE